MQWLNGAAYPEKRGFSVDLKSRKKGIEENTGSFHTWICLSLHGHSPIYRQTFTFQPGPLWIR